MLQPKPKPMKRVLITSVFTAVSILAFSQSMRSDGQTRVSLLTDVKGIASSNSSPGGNAGVGKLGASFTSKNLYGSIVFNVISGNDGLESDSNEIRTFTNNLLIPDKSGRGLSNFNISLGLKSFSNLDMESFESKPLLSFARFGAFGFWQVNNTIWTKESVSTPVYISSLGVYLTYSILNVKLLDDNRGKVHLFWFGGIENRILSGDYSLEKNKSYREHFIEDERLKFWSFPTVGFKLEIGDFYGEVTETNFSGNLDGFSGWQARIVVGLNVDLTIAAEDQ